MLEFPSYPPLQVTTKIKKLIFIEHENLLSIQSYYISLYMGFSA